MRESITCVYVWCKYLWVERVAGIWAPTVFLHLQSLALKRFIMCSWSQGTNRQRGPSAGSFPAGVHFLFVMERNAWFFF